MLRIQTNTDKGIRVSLSSPVPCPAPLLLDSMNREQFNRIMEIGLNQTKAGLSRDADTVFDELERGL